MKYGEIIKLTWRNCCPISTHLLRSTTLALLFTLSPLFTPKYYPLGTEYATNDTHFRFFFNQIPGSYEKFRSRTAASPLNLCLTAEITNYGGGKCTILFVLLKTPFEFPRKDEVRLVLVFRYLARAVASYRREMCRALFKVFNKSNIFRLESCSGSSGRPNSIGYRAERKTFGVSCFFCLN